MSTLYPFVVAVHGAVGMFALLAFWIAATVRKGSSLHRRVGQGYLLAMLGIIATALPLAWFRYLQGQPVIAAFLAYLAVITATGVWNAWRAIRDKHDVLRYAGPACAGFAWLSLGAGPGMLVMGVRIGSPLVAGFSTIGLFLGQDMLRNRHNPGRLSSQLRWWLAEHYSAMLGNGVATHIAFLAIGLPRLLAAVDGTTLHYVAWFGPVGVALLAKVVLDRRWRRPVSTAVPSPRQPLASN